MIKSNIPPNIVYPKWVKSNFNTSIISIESILYGTNFGLGRINKLNKLYCETSELTYNSFNLLNKLNLDLYAEVPFILEGVNKFVVFVDYYAPSINSVIEIDGKSHCHTGEFDRLRDDKISKLGIHILRFNRYNYKEISNLDSIPKTNITKLDFTPLGLDSVPDDYTRGNNFSVLETLDKSKTYELKYIRHLVKDNHRKYKSLCIEKCNKLGIKLYPEDHFDRLNIKRKLVGINLSDINNQKVDRSKFIELFDLPNDNKAILSFINKLHNYEGIKVSIVTRGKISRYQGKLLTTINL